MLEHKFSSHLVNIILHDFELTRTKILLKYQSSQDKDLTKKFVYSLLRYEKKCAFPKIIEQFLTFHNEKMIRLAVFLKSPLSVFIHPI